MVNNIFIHAGNENIFSMYECKRPLTKVDTNKHYVLESGHPSPLSANRGHWFDNKHFTKCNIYLESKNLQPIKWV